MLILPSYQLFTRLKKKVKIVKKTEIKYLLFIKKYAARILIFLIVLIVTTNNIFAKGYSPDEITNKSLLIKIVSPPEERFNELIEEESSSASAPLAINYATEQGNLQENVITTPFPEDPVIAENNNVSPDASSLVMNEPLEEGSGDAVITDRTETVEYTVQEGDVLGAIAERFEISVNTILWENNLTWNSTIRPGQKLRIPPGTGISYTVASGDTVLGIAKKYQADADQIININKLASATDIKAGQKLFIPNGIKPTQVTSSYKPRTAPTYEPRPTVTETPVDSGAKLLWPTDSQRITQYFSLRHTGLDIGNKTGNPIYAAESGKVEKAGWNSGGYGNYVIINHGNGLTTLYAHASKLYVSAGDTVARGDLIAAVGNTGRSTGPHLHFEVRSNDSRTNPLNYVK